MSSQMKHPAAGSAWQIEAGGQIADGRSALDIVRSDDEPLPTILAKPGDLHPAPRPISFERYFSDHFVELEATHIWKKHWQVACRVEDIPRIGDRVNYDILDNSYLVVRTGASTFAAFHNACRHRGRKL